MVRHGGCPCEGLPIEDLIPCLAPPPGEYEVHVGLAGRVMLVISSSGYSVRAVMADESLPFLRTIDKPVEPAEAAKLLGDRLEDTLCRVIEALKEAADHGSLDAGLRIRECSGLIESIASSCRAEHR